MQRFTSGLIVLILAVPLWAQKIETATPNRDRVVPIHTALDHLTVIEVGEPVVTVAAGSAAFKVEWRDNKVFIEPTEPGVSTNLFIWTASSRLNYELESAGEVGKMDFAIDYPKPTPPPPAAKVANSSGSHVGGGDPVDQVLRDRAHAGWTPGAFRVGQGLPVTAWMFSSKTCSSRTTRSSSVMRFATIRTASTCPAFPGYLP